MADMNFASLPGTVVGLVAGWIFTVYLQRRANHRAEALKRKDKLVDKLEGLSDWVEGEITKSNFSAINTERSYTAMLSQLELKMIQFNKHVRKNVIDPSELVDLRNANFYLPAAQLPDLPYDIRDFAADVIEHIEGSCNSMFFDSSLLRRAESVYHDLKGVIAGIGVVIAVIILGKVIAML